MPTNTDLISFVDLATLQVIVETKEAKDKFEVLDRSNSDGILNVRIRFQSNDGSPLSTCSIRWTIPAINVKGIWSSNLLYEKRIRADWETPSLNSRISTDAPLVTLFDHEDQNILAAAIDDMVHPVSIAAPVREEDNLVYFDFILFEENQDSTRHEVELRIDSRSLLYSTVIQDVARWWEDKLAYVLPPFRAAFEPVYSTWYAYHQQLNEDELLNECRQAVPLGYKVIILDDGWQTMDNKRGYDFTGDWEAERFDDMTRFVKDVHDTGMKMMLWYAVPFCGKHSNAYQKFKGKLLTDNHRWAPVLDPRYPEVRAHLIGLYTRAMQDWDIDGFKLDFIDEFKMYPASAIGKGDGRDYANVEEAVERLLNDAITAMRKVKSELIIEFRQKYISPALRQFANMFRAFDCPNDAVTNRIRTTDVKLLCGDSAVHSDMITWPIEESVEVAAIQMANIIFSVPQISVRLDETSAGCKDMIRFYTAFWLEHRDLLMHGAFQAQGPISNYPILRSAKNGTEVIGIYDQHLVELSGERKVFLVNGKSSPSLIIDKTKAEHLSEYIVRDCKGFVVANGNLDVSSSLESISVPQCGIVEVN